MVNLVLIVLLEVVCGSCFASVCVGFALIVFLIVRVCLLAVFWGWF